MKTLALTRDEEAMLGALLWRFRFTLARMTGQGEMKVQMLAEIPPAIPVELCEAVDTAIGGIDADIAEVPASMRSEFAEKARIIDSILQKLCEEGELNQPPRH